VDAKAAQCVRTCCCGYVIHTALSCLSFWFGLTKTTRQQVDHPESTTVSVVSESHKQQRNGGNHVLTFYAWGVRGCRAQGSRRRRSAGVDGKGDRGEGGAETEIEASSAYQGSAKQNIEGARSRAVGGVVHCVHEQALPVFAKSAPRRCASQSS